MLTAEGPAISFSLSASFHPLSIPNSSSITTYLLAVSTRLLTPAPSLSLRAPYLSESFSSFFLLPHLPSSLVCLRSFWLYTSSSPSFSPRFCAPHAFLPWLSSISQCSPRCFKSTVLFPSPTTFSRFFLSFFPLIHFSVFILVMSFHQCSSQASSRLFPTSRSFVLPLEEVWSIICFTESDFLLLPVNI